MISLPSGPEVHAYSDGPAVHQQVSLSLNFFGGVFLEAHGNLQASGVSVLVGEAADFRFQQLKSSHYLELMASASPVTRCKYLECPALPSSLPQRLHCSWLPWKEYLSLGICGMDSVWTQLRECFCGPLGQDKSRWLLIIGLVISYKL